MITQLCSWWYGGDVIAGYGGRWGTLANLTFGNAVDGPAVPFGKDVMAAS